MSKVLVVDTSILCVWLKVPFFDTCGSDRDLWTYNRVEAHLKQRLGEGYTLVLPLATIIETGNHIAQSKTGDRFVLASRLADLLHKVADAESPWAAFVDQAGLWQEKSLREIASHWPKRAAECHSMGDMTITLVADHYARARLQVEIWTGDAGLRNHQPTTPLSLAPPRRRQR